MKSRIMFKKKENLVGLDIGSASIKAAEITQTKTGQKLMHFGLIDIAPGIIEDGIIKDFSSLSNSIKELLHKNNIKETNVAISLGGLSIIVKKINIKQMDENQLQDVIVQEAEQYIPFDINDIYLDFHILGDSDRDTNQMSLLLVATRKEVVDNYVKLVQTVGLNPCVVDVDSLALQNIFQANYDTSDENVSLIDIGLTKTSLNILKNNTSIFIRDVPLGCGQINNKISSFVNCTLEEAEQIKHSLNPDKISYEDLQEIISDVLSEWCIEIKRAFDFFYSTYPDDQIKKIFMSGGGGNIKQLYKLLADETSTQVEAINPFSNFLIDENRFDMKFIEKIAPQAAICMGLTLRKINDK